VYEVNTRTESAFADFSSRLFQIYDENKTPRYWIPFSTFEKAWAVSPALQEHPELLEKLSRSKWGGGDFESNPIPRDHALWAFRSSLGAKGLFGSEEEKLHLLSVASAEIDEAFANGSLKKDTSRIYISRATPGKTMGEIFDLGPMVLSGIKTAVFFRWYETQLGPYDNDLSNQYILSNYLLAEALIHDTFATQEDFEQPDIRFALSAGTAVITAYQSAAFVLFPLSIAGFILLIIFAIRKTKGSSLFLLYLMPILALTAAAQIFSAAWFAEHIREMAMLGYTAGAVPVIQVFEILGVYTLVRFLYSKRTRKNQS